MIAAAVSETRFFETGAPSSPGPVFRRRYRSGDTAAHVARQIEALQSYSSGVPRAVCAGREEIRWIG